ncbi:MAG: hypothetical protein BWY08_01846 [Bacteroidetes bacterium ADurb.Bin174]|jgi:hypothetical protein|nr:MAG: hypothetical protein BWY08_01846 [Bacteroidetes bacterium ADurb.Bin174]
MKTKLFCTLLILSTLVGCEKITGVYYCIKNDTQHDIKIEHIGMWVQEKEFHIAPSQVYEAFYSSIDFETLPSREDTFYVFMDNKKYMDIFDLKTSLTRPLNYVYDTTKKTKTASYAVFSINKEYIDSLIEIE